MNKKKIILTAVLSIALLGIQALPVLASNGTDVKIKAGTADGPNEKVEAACVMEGQEQITNGKIRILYDAGQLKLESTSAGSAVAETSVQINDPLTGNKPEGEIVLVFASAMPVNAEGSVLDMVFSTTDAYQTDTGAEIQVKVEEFANNGSDVEKSEQNGVVYPGVVTPPESPDTENPTQPNQPDKTPDGGENPESKDPAPSHDKKEPVLSDKSSNNTAVGKSNNIKTKSVKTGDETEILIPVLTGIAALASVCGIFAVRKKRKDA